jgi:tetratricopeptide (TPR) repeat protein
MNIPFSKNQDSIQNVYFIAAVVVAGVFFFIGYQVLKSRGNLNLSFGNKNEVVSTGTTLPSPSPESTATKNARLLDEDEDALIFYQGNIIRFENARDHLEEFTQEYPQDARARALLGLAKIVAKEDGHVDVEESLRLEPGNVTALRTKINNFMVTGEVEAAQYVYDDLVKYHPESELVYLYKARFANRRLDYKTALELVTKELDTKRTQMRKDELYLALIIQEFSAEHLKKYDIAEKAYQDIVELTHGPWNYQSYAIFLIYRTKDYQKAIKVMEQGIAESDFPAGRMTLQDAHYWAGKELYEQKKYLEAIEMFDEGVKIYPHVSPCPCLKKIRAYYMKYWQMTHEQVYLDKAKYIDEILDN